MSSLPFEKRRIEVLNRYESKSEYGTNPYERDIKEHLKYGVINLDKPSGPTSHNVADMVKKLFKANSTGHGGTLDPRVTGVLPVALNNATRVLRVFLLGGKEYVCEMMLHSKTSEKEVKKAFDKFTGIIEQLPPIKSSVKRVLRKREIYYIDFLEMSKRSVLFRVGCEAGTYIRKLCTDIGDYLGVKAHMQNLRRTKASCFNEIDSVSLFDLQDALTLFREKKNDSLLRKVVRPIEEAVTHLRRVWLSDGGVGAVSYGAKLMLPGVVKLDSGIKMGEPVAMLSLKNELVALGEATIDSEEMFKGNKGVCVVPKTVFMKIGIYPKSWKTTHSKAPNQ